MPIQYVVYMISYFRAKKVFYVVAGGVRQLGINSANQWMTLFNRRITDANQRITSSNRRITSSNQRKVMQSADSLCQSADNALQSADNRSQSKHFDRSALNFCVLQKAIQLFIGKKKDETSFD